MHLRFFARPFPWLPTSILLAILPAVIVSFLPYAASAQPLPVTRLAYSAKYMCGTQANDFSLPLTTSDYSVIEVHNPHTVAVVCTVKVVQDYPTSQIITPKYAVTIAANGTLNFDCTTLYPGFIPVTPMRRGFVEIIAPRQIKVVGLYKETLGWAGRIASVSIAKKSSPAFILFGFIRHSGTFLVGDEVQASGDTIRHETTISVANMSPNPVNAQISIVSKTGLVTSFPRTLSPNGFTAITGADLPPATPRPFVGAVTVQYTDTGFGALLECEEIIQKHAISGIASGAMTMSMMEIQPIPLR